MKIKKYESLKEYVVDMGREAYWADIATMKGYLIGKLIDAVEKEELTHAEVARQSKVPRSAITGIINGSLAQVTFDRLIRILLALNLRVEIKVKKNNKVSKANKIYFQTR